MGPERLSETAMSYITLILDPSIVVLEYPSDASYITMYVKAPDDCTLAL